MYTFTIPYLFLGCLYYDIVPYEHFNNFEIYQPIVITATHDAYILNLFIEANHYCDKNGNVIIIRGADK